MLMKTGARYRSQVCDTEVIVVRALPGDVDLTCGGHALQDLTAERITGGTPEAGADTGSLLGKRYTDVSGKLELLVTKGGAGGLALDGALLLVKDAKPLPASD